MAWSNLRFCLKVFVTMATNLTSCFSIQFSELLLKFLVKFTLMKYVRPQRSYRFLVPIIKCTCTVFIDNFKNILTNSSI